MPGLGFVTITSWLGAAGAFSGTVTSKSLELTNVVGKGGMLPMRTCAPGEKLEPNTWIAVLASLVTFALTVVTTGAVDGAAVLTGAMVIPSTVAPFDRVACCTIAAPGLVSISAVSI